MSDLDFSSKTVLVVGGSSGIGNGIAHSFKNRGAEVHVWGTRATADDYASEEGSDISGLNYACVNVSDFDALEKYEPPFDKVDVVVLCQGIVRYKREEFTRPGWEAVMDVNINSVMHCATKFYPMLAQSKGALIIVSSVAGFRAAMGNPAYAASKAGAVGLCATLGEAWAADGIRVNGIAPGFVDTKITKVTTGNEKRLQGTLQKIPARRLGTPEDMAGAALYLASPLASYVYGQTIIVDGGLSLS